MRQKTNLEFKETIVTKTLKWGILGLGNIANYFSEDLKLVEGNVIQAAASRSMKKAAAFGRRYQVPNVYDSYTKLMEDERVDIIYIATPHNSHMQYAMEAMSKGKHVLCEKPLAVNQDQVKEMIDCAAENEVFLMEALWSRFNPALNAVVELINDGAIGEIRYINADFSFHTKASEENRLLNPELAGGALLDVGVYPLFLAYLLLGIPDQIVSSSTFHRTGVDVQTSAILNYQESIAQIMGGFLADSDMVAKVYGSKGQLYIDSLWYQSEGFRVETKQSTEAFHFPKKGRGFTYEIEECHKCISSGKLQSDLWSHQDSLQLITLMDEIRRQSGIRYPFE